MGLSFIIYDGFLGACRLMTRDSFRAHMHISPVLSLFAFIMLFSPVRSSWSRPSGALAYETGKEKAVPDAPGL